VHVSLSQYSSTFDERFWAIVAAEGGIGHLAKTVPFDDDVDVPAEPDCDDGPLFRAVSPRAKSVPFGEPSEGDAEESGEDEADSSEEEESD
jgi:hypothetical protein